jgi:hypothetical protein
MLALTPAYDLVSSISMEGDLRLEVGLMIPDGQPGVRVRAKGMRPAIRIQAKQTRQNQQAKQV